LNKEKVLCLLENVFNKMLSTGYKNVTGCNYAIIINVFFFLFFLNMICIELHLWSHWPSFPCVHGVK